TRSQRGSSRAGGQGGRRTRGLGTVPGHQGGRARARAENAWDGDATANPVLGAPGVSVQVKGRAPHERPPGTPTWAPEIIKIQTGSGGIGRSNGRCERPSSLPRAIKAGARRRWANRATVRQSMYWETKL